MIMHPPPPGMDYNQQQYGNVCKCDLKYNSVQFSIFT